MPFIDFRTGHGCRNREQGTPLTRTSVHSVTFAVSLALLSLGAFDADAASLTRRVEVATAPSDVWSAIGPFCAIKNWLPPVGTCTEDGKAPPTRTLVSTDGNSVFVELQTARSDARHFYSYTFISSPLPVTHYTSTISVAAKAKGLSIVTWRGTYTPKRGKENEAHAALAAIYRSGLDAIKSRFAQSSRP